MDEWTGMEWNGMDMHKCQGMMLAMIACVSIIGNCMALRLHENENLKTLLYGHAKIRVVHGYQNHITLELCTSCFSSNVPYLVISITWTPGHVYSWGSDISVNSGNLHARTAVPFF